MNINELHKLLDALRKKKFEGQNVDDLISFYEKKMDELLIKIQNNVNDMIEWNKEYKKTTSVKI